MKMKFLKIGMPLMVFMLAIVFAFATEPKNSMDNTLVMGYIFKDGICQSVDFDCNELEDLPCEYDGSLVHRFNNFTYCSEILYHKPD